MANATAPLPIQTPLLDANKVLTLTWARWLKTISDFAQDAGNVRTSNGMSYCRSGAQACIAYSGSGGLALELPYNPVVLAVFDCYDGSTWTKVSAQSGANGRWSVTLPAGPDVKLSGVYLAEAT